MKQNSTLTKVLFALLAAVFVLSCSLFTGGDAPEPTKPPEKVSTEAPETEAPAATEAPVATEAPATEAPDPAMDEFNALLQKFDDKGYISTTEGEITTLSDFKEEWAQIGYFNYWTYDVTTSDEFVFKAHFNWSTASSTPDPSGCGVVFGLQDSGDYYVVFLTHDHIRFRLARGGNLYEVGKTSGKGTTNFGNPAESEFALAVSNQKAYVSVDGDVTTYTLSMDQTTAGAIALSLRSGTNKDYGTRCEATEMFVWSR